MKYIFTEGGDFPRIIAIALLSYLFVRDPQILLHVSHHREDISVVATPVHYLGEVRDFHLSLSYLC